MKNMRINIIEKIKDVLLVVLVFTTILLLYFLWGNNSLEAFIFNESEEIHTVVGSQEILLPDQIVLSRGNADYTISSRLKEELWKGQILQTFRTFSNGSNILVEEITREQYQEVMKYPSILAKFRYNIPFSGFCEKYDIKQSQGYDSIGSLQEIGFSTGSRESAFIYDGSKKKYYRMVGTKKLELFGNVDSIVEENGYTTYYTLKTFLGEESTNEALIPVEFPAAIVPIPFERDMVTGNSEIIGDMAKAYFGETFDFVRTIEESNGTIIYMYGYGQKVLIINPNDGSIEYKEEIKTTGTEQKSMFEMLDIALSFISSHGGFETVKEQKIKPYLENVLPIGDKKNSYRFTFGFSVGTSKIFYEEQIPLVVEITDGQVSYFRRQLINYDEEQAEKRSSDEGVSAINMLAMNYEYMKNALTHAGVIDKETARTISFEEIANKIDNVYTGYLKPKAESGSKAEKNESEDVLLPVWTVEINGILLYFDLYDGEPKGYSSRY